MPMLFFMDILKNMLRPKAVKLGRHYYSRRKWTKIQGFLMSSLLACYSWNRPALPTSWTERARVQTIWFSVSLFCRQGWGPKGFLLAIKHMAVWQYAWGPSSGMAYLGFSPIWALEIKVSGFALWERSALRLKSCWTTGVFRYLKDFLDKNVWWRNIVMFGMKTWYFRLFILKLMKDHVSNWVGNCTDMKQWWWGRFACECREA